MDSQNLIDVRCPLPSVGRPEKQCHKLCVRVTPGSAGKAYCARHEAEFDFQVDDFNAFDYNHILEKPLERLRPPTQSIHH